jgi:hypothetical protein
MMDMGLLLCIYFILSFLQIVVCDLSAEQINIEWQPFTLIKRQYLRGLFPFDRTINNPLSSFKNVDPRYNF